MVQDDNRIIIEFVPVGRYVKVSAIDPKTGIEVSIVGDPRQGEALLQRLAAQKLRYVMAKRREGGPTGGRIA